MKVLLDTHIWIWNLSGSSKLPQSIKRLLANARHQLFLSPISIWETLILAEKGRLNLKPDPIRWIHQAWEVGGVQDIALSHNIVLKSRQLSVPYQDPADCFIAATCLVHDLTLVTLDERLREIRELKIFPK